MSGQGSQHHAVVSAAIDKPLSRKPPNLWIQTAKNVALQHSYFLNSGDTILIRLLHYKFWGKSGDTVLNWHRHQCI
jgi:hypothetical protein